MYKINVYVSGKHFVQEYKTLEKANKAYERCVIQWAKHTLKFGQFDILIEEWSLARPYMSAYKIRSFKLKTT